MLSDFRACCWTRPSSANLPGLAVGGLGGFHLSFLLISVSLASKCLKASKKCSPAIDLPWEAEPQQSNPPPLSGLRRLPGRNRRRRREESLAFLNMLPTSATQLFGSERMTCSTQISNSADFVEPYVLTCDLGCKH